MAGDPDCDLCVCGRQKRTVYVVAATSNYESRPDYLDLENEVISLRRELAAAKAEVFRLRNQKRFR